MGYLGRASCAVHLFSAQTSQEGIKCSKAKEWLRPYFPNIYCQCLKSTTRDILWHSRKFKDFFLPCVAAELCSFHLMYTRGFQTYNFVLQRGLDSTLEGVKSTAIDLKSGTSFTNLECQMVLFIEAHIKSQ